ncbi:MAG TPA: hypothetical protein VKE96_05930 [Vicinamibacterales bacterium]|nr:hypothetical protein [Vicinamibacterales bacterium]
MKSVVPVLYDSGAPVSGAVVRLNIGPSQYVSGTSGADGTANLVVDSRLQDTQFEISAAGFQPYGLHVNLGLVGNLQLRVGLGADPSRPQDLILPPLVRTSKPLPNLGDAGNFWVDRINGTDQFCALRMSLDGKDLTPLIKESQGLTFNCWRIFCQGSIAQNGVLDLFPQRIGDAYYSTLANLCRLLNGQGIVPLLTVFADNQDVQLGPPHWSRLAETVAPFTVLLSGGNEWTKNGFNPQALPIPPVHLWSRGSDVGDAAPPKANGGTFSEFHPRRDFPKALDDAVASATFLHGGGYGKLVVDEPPRMGTDGSDPVYANAQTCWRFARHYATEWAGAVFHSRAGQRGVLMDDLTRTCAAEWSRGFLNAP